MDAQNEPGQRPVAPRPGPRLLGIPVPLRAFGAALTWSTSEDPPGADRPALTVIDGGLAA